MMPAYQFSATRCPIGSSPRNQGYLPRVAKKNRSEQESKPLHPPPGSGEGGGSSAAAEEGSVAHTIT